MYAKNYVPQNPPTPEQVDRWESQEERVFQFFFLRPATMLQAERSTNVMRSNICRYTAHWRAEGKIMQVKIDLDPITKRNAKYWSTNKQHWPGFATPGEQLEFFQP